MNELPTSPEPMASPLLPNTTPSPQRADRRLYAGLGVLAVLLAAQWWNSHTQVSKLREELAQRLRAGDTINAETKVLVKSVHDSVQELQGKVSVLESKQQEAQSQQVALEQLYQDLSKNRDEWALSEIEQVLSTASQQLQLAGNVQGALIALQNADNRLASANKPQFITIRRAIARDLEKLKTLPNVDIPGIAVRIDSAIAQIDNMPLLSDEKPVEATTPPKPERTKAPSASGGAASLPAEPDWLTRLQEAWRSWSNEMWTEVRQLVQVRKVDEPDALLLSPTQAFYARENLKLRLLNARLALLSRNESDFRNDLVAAQDAIAKYFDTRAKQTQTVQSLLRQVQGSNLSIEMPTLADSLTAVRNYKANP